MAYKFNPFTGKLDESSAGGGGGTPGGSNTQVQFNDSNSFGGDDGLTFNKTTNVLTVGASTGNGGSAKVYGDINLDDGGSFTTTVQCVTPTQNRTISFPDATGTVALVAGSSGQLLWNNAGANAGASTLTYDGSILTTSGRFINSYNATTGSNPAKVFTGTWFTGGTGTTTKPHFLIEPSGTTSTGWSTSGTALGVNAASGFGGNLLDLQVNGTSRTKVSQSGSVDINVPATNTVALNIAAGGGGDVIKVGSAFGIGFTGNTYSLLATNYPGFQVGAQGTGRLTILGSTDNPIVLTPQFNVSEQRNGTNAQTFRVYNTFTDASNYERLSTTWSSNVCYTKPENAGTGSARLYVPVTGSTTVAGLPAASTAGAGARAFVTDANATTFLSTVAGGGSNKVPVVSDGTNWLIG